MFESMHDGSPFGGLQESEVSRRSLLKYFGIGAAAVGASPLLAACGSGSGAAGAGAAKFTIASFPGDTYLIDAVNAANKDFAKHDLNVPKFIAPQSGVQALQLMTAGAVNGYAADTLLLMASHVNGTKGKRPVIAGFRTVSTTYGIVVGKKGNWPAADASFEEKMQSLKGKKVGVTAVGAGGDLQLRLALESAGMKSTDVTHLAVGPSLAAIPNLNAGRLDAYVTVQWTAGRFSAKETGGHVLLDFSEPGVPAVLREQAVLAIGVREDFAEQKPEVVQNWLKAQWDANVWMQSHKADAAKILNANTFAGKAPEIATAYMDHYVQDVAPALKPMFKADKETVDRMAKLAERFGSVKAGQINFEEIVPSFARA